MKTTQELQGWIVIALLLVFLFMVGQIGYNIQAIKIRTEVGGNGPSTVLWFEGDRPEEYEDDGSGSVWQDSGHRGPRGPRVRPRRLYNRSGGI